MRINKVCCAGMLSLALSGLSVSAKADSISVETITNEYGNLSGDFELPGLTPQPQPVGDNHRRSDCCRLGIRAGDQFYEDFNFSVPDGVRVQSGHKGIPVLANDIANVPQSELSGLPVWARADSSGDGMLSNEFSNSGAVYGGYENFAALGSNTPGLNMLGFGPFFDGIGNTLRTGPVDAGNGQGSPPASTNAPSVSPNPPVPLPVSEPSSLALLAAGLAAVGVLMLKRTT
jgi:hypothetical protein